MARYQPQGKNFHCLIKSQNPNLSKAYDVLISSTRIFNRYFMDKYGEKAQMEKILFIGTDAIQDFSTLDDWVGKLLIELYQGRKD